MSRKSRMNVAGRREIRYDDRRAGDRCAEHSPTLDKRGPFDDRTAPWTRQLHGMAKSAGFRHSLPSPLGRQSRPLRSSPLVNGLHQATAAVD
jgi:hypothetical protein